jgi:putative ABC transport system permease protein
MPNFVQDLRYGLRMLRKNRGATVIAVAALALGIGANTAIFSVVNAVLLAPLPYREPDRIVTLLNRGNGPASPADFQDWRAKARSFESMATAEAWFVSLTGRERPEQIAGLHLSEDMFRLLGVPPALGRTFVPEDFQAGKDHVVVLSDRLWKRRFNRDRGVIGQQILLDREPYTIVGVMPPKFRFMPFWITGAEIWGPQNQANRSVNRAGHSLRPLARLKPGVTCTRAQAEMDAICSRLAKAYPDSDASLTIQVQPLLEKVVGDVRPALLMILGAVGFVLLIACANVANVQLARALGRTREIAIRTAMGAGRLRIVRQLLTESVVLSLGGGALGLVLAFWGIDALRTFVQDGDSAFTSKIPRGEDIGLNALVLTFSLALSLVTGIVFGLFPALHVAKGDLNKALKEGGRSATHGAAGNRMRGLLVISEVAITLVLLIGAGLLVRSFMRLEAIDPGFNPRNLLSMTVSVAGNSQYVGVRREALYGEIVDQVRALPGVQSASMVNHLPLFGDTWGLNLFIEGRPLPRPGEDVSAIYRVARPGYFQAMQIPLLAGRDFTGHDTRDTPPVVIVNERLAKAFWPDGGALGKRLTLDDPRKDPVWYTVVGLIKDVKQNDWAAKPDYEYYFAALQNKNTIDNPQPWFSYMTLVVRTSDDPLAFSQAVQNTVWSIDKSLPLASVKTMEEAISASVWQPRFNLLLVGLFAGLALVLAAVGIYGVMAYSVTERTHEIGIRMALGAKQSDVLRLVVREGMALAAIGGAIGLAGAFALTRLLGGLLYQVQATDPAIFGAVPCLFAAVAFLASYIPARRATRVDPLIALRWE